MCIASLLSHPPSSPHPTLLGHHRAPSWVPCAYSSFPLASYFTQESVYMSVICSQFISPSPSRPASTILFSTSEYSFLPCKQIHRPHFPLGFIETRMQCGFFFSQLKYSWFKMCHMELCSVLCGRLGGGQFGEECILVYVRLSPFTIHLTLSEHCELAISQYKIKSF